MVGDGKSRLSRFEDDALRILEIRKHHRGLPFVVSISLRWSLEGLPSDELQGVPSFTA